MGALLRPYSYLFHPLLVPTYAGLLYFLIARRFLDEGFLFERLFPIALMTVLLPLLLYAVLYQLGAISGVFAPGLKERRAPLLLAILLYTVLVWAILPLGSLSFYFIGLIAGLLPAYLFLWLGFRSSIHMLYMGSLWMFLVGLSFHYAFNLSTLLALVTLAAGLVASSRLHMRAHSPIELLIGLFLGLLGQLVHFEFWL